MKLLYNSSGFIKTYPLDDIAWRQSKSNTANNHFINLYRLLLLTE